MKIILSDIGKRFGKQWLFRSFHASFNKGDRIGIEGINGSGKSSFIQVVAGISLPSEGKLSYFDEAGKELDLNELAGNISIVSPYMDIPEQLNITELFHFQRSFLPFQEGIDLQKLLEITFLEDRKNDLVKQFSSGMKQRLKLGLAFLSRSTVLFLDEPCSNLDEAGKSMYKRLLQDHSRDRIIFIASNEADDELIDCNKTYQLREMKQNKNK